MLLTAAASSLPSRMWRLHMEIMCLEMRDLSYSCRLRRNWELPIMAWQDFQSGSLPSVPVGLNAYTQNSVSLIMGCGFLYTFTSLILSLSSTARAAVAASRAGMARSSLALASAAATSIRLLSSCSSSSLTRASSCCSVARALLSEMDFMRVATLTDCSATSFCATSSLACMVATVAAASLSLVRPLLRRSERWRSFKRPVPICDL
mmetsp:Transcript_23307/g.88390  ORF Transcript_23307/g.88390 Transcript_23307/m.88390 type:complete len:206 (+) Transcript_23307:3863-4480(+)